MRNRIGWFGGIRCLQFTPSLGPDVRINEDILNCVCFLGVHRTVDGQDQFEVGGTGFFIATGDHQRAKTATYYIATAKHVVLEGDQVGGLHARINRKDGGFEYVDLRNLDTKWKKADNEDVAIIRFALQGARDDVLDYTLIPQVEFATPQWIKEKAIGPSDEVAVTGLFVPHKGAGQNLPIIRGGIIAAMPNENEPVTAESKVCKVTAPAYLLELHSSGGLSGSPVLVMTEPHRLQDGKIATRSEGTKLLALVSGHWPLDFPFPLTRDAREQLSELNRGIAIGVPIEALSRLLEREDVVQERDKRRAVRAKKDAATLDSVFSDEEQPQARGFAPERLKIDQPMDEAVKKMFEAGKPPKE